MSDLYTPATEAEFNAHLDAIPGLQEGGVTADTRCYYDAADRIVGLISYDPYQTPMGRTFRIAKAPIDPR